MNTRMPCLAMVAVAIFSVSCLGQDASDVELKPYGSYTGGGIDTINLTTGNVFLHIPILSYPQLGKLPPLSFSVELNNAPYNQNGSLPEPDNPETSYLKITRYDVSPPGAPDHAPIGTLYTTHITSDPRSQNVGTQNTWFPNMGAYITSSFGGGIATESQLLNGAEGYPSSYGYSTFSGIDPSGTTHELNVDLDSFLSSSDIYRAPDGSGYEFIPAGPCNAWDALNCGRNNTIWLGPMSGNPTYLRTGTIVSPSGVKYTDTIGTYDVPYPRVPRLVSTAQDPMGNTITRGPWYWSGLKSDSIGPEIGNDNSSVVMQTYYGIQSLYGVPPPYTGPRCSSTNPSTVPKYTDSVGRTIPDILTMQQALPYPGSAATSICWNVPGVNGALKTYVIDYQGVTWGGGAINPDGIVDPAIFAGGSGWVITAIHLPNGTQWTFEYAGVDLKKVTTPSGGSITYTYTTVEVGDDHLSPVLLCNGICHAVRTRTESDGTNSWTTTYNYSAVTTLTGCPTAMATTETDDLGNDTVHTFCALKDSVSIVNASSFHEVRTDYYQGLSTATPQILLKTVATQYQFNREVFSSGITNVLPTSVATTIHNSNPNDAAPAVTTTSTYSAAAGKPLFRAVWVSCTTAGCTRQGESENVSYIEPVSQNTLSAGVPLRSSSTLFKWMRPQDSTYLAQNLLDLPDSRNVFDGTGAIVSATTYGYDELGSPQGIYGNQTSVTRGVPPDHVMTSTQYNSYGMPSATIDGNGNTTSIIYDSTKLFPRQVQHPSTGGTAHVDFYTHDSSFGKVIDHTDQNGNKTSYSYDDVARVTDVKYPATQAGTGESVMCYTDEGGPICSHTGPPYSVYINTVSSPSPDLVTVHTYDGLGRKINDTVKSDPSGPVLVDTKYDEYGRVTSVTNPYRAAAAPGDPPQGTTLTTYDALGRVIKQTRPDSSAVWSCYNHLRILPDQPNCSWYQVSTSYSYWVDTTDEIGHHTQRVTDPLGRLSYVVEPEWQSNALAYKTHYLYDVLDNLTEVDQFGDGGINGPLVHYRSFDYDSLSRLVDSYNPETGTITYGYDGNGNLTLKTDARGITINYSPPESPIDALNRVTKKTYSTSSGANLEPPVSFVYDNNAIPNGIGRLSKEYTGASSAPITSRTVLGYDAMGRVTSEQRCILTSRCTVDSNRYTMSFTYDSAGKLTSYPSGYGDLSFTHTYDGAGRILKVSSTSQGNQQPTSIFSMPQYTPSGALSGVMLGSGLSISRTFDERQRITSETDTHIVSVNGSPGVSEIGIVGAEQAK